MAGYRWYVCNTGPWTQREHDEALEKVLASGQPLCRASKATGFVGQCVVLPESNGWCHMHKLHAADGAGR